MDARKNRMSQSLFTAILYRENSPAAPSARECYRLCRNYQTDPALALAVFGVLSKYGTDEIIQHTCNWGLLSHPHAIDRAIDRDTRLSLAIYPRWGCGLHDMLDYWQHKYRANYTLRHIACTYTPLLERNQTERLIIDIEDQIREWEQADGYR